MPTALRSLALSTTAVLAALALLGAAEGVAEAEGKIAIVDVQGAVLHTEDGMRAQGMLKKLFDKKQSDIEAKQTELKRAQDDIQRQSHVLSREALQKRMEDWQARMVKLQTDFVDHQQELQKKQAELTGPIVKKMMGIIARLAKKNGYELIFDKQAAAYVRPDLDLTDQVVQLYNSGGGADDAPAEEKKPDGK